IGDASRFGLEYPVTELAVHEFIERAQRQRAAGVSFTYVVLVNGRAVGGVMQVRRLDPAFEAAEWEATLAPSARGTGAFIEAARIFVLTTVAAGVVMLALYLPYTRITQPFLFFVLLVLSSATAALKVHLPLTTSGSTMSVSYAVDFASLLLIGPDQTMVVAA